MTHRTCQSDRERHRTLAALFEKLLGWKQRWHGEVMNGGETRRVGEGIPPRALHRPARSYRAAEGPAAQPRWAAGRRSRRGRPGGDRPLARAVQSRRLRAGATVLLLRLGRVVSYAPVS